MDFFAMKQMHVLKPCSHRFWRDYNLLKHILVACHFFAVGKCFDELKMQEMLEKGLIAKTAQKGP